MLHTLIFSTDLTNKSNNGWLQGWFLHLPNPIHPWRLYLGVISFRKTSLTNTISQCCRARRLGCLSSPRPCWYLSVSITSAVVCLLPNTESRLENIVVAAVVQPLSRVWLCNPMGCSTPASLSFAIFWSLLKFMSFESVMPSNYLILRCSLLLLPSIFPNIRIFSNFASGGQSVGASASASVLPVNTQRCFPLGLTGLISLQSKGLSRVFSNTTGQKHKFFGAPEYFIARVDTSLTQETSLFIFNHSHPPAFPFTHQSVKITTHGLSQERA